MASVKRDVAGRNRSEGYRRPSVGLPVRLINARGFCAAYHGVAGISQKQIGELAGELLGKAIPQRTISNWEKGIAAPDLDSLAAIADVSGVSRAWLVLAEGKPGIAGAAFQPDIQWRPRERVSAADAGEVFPEGDRAATLPPKKRKAANRGRRS